MHRNAAFVPALCIVSVYAFRRVAVLHVNYIAFLQDLHILFVYAVAVWLSHMLCMLSS